MAATLTSGVITINFDDNPANFLPNQSASAHACKYSLVGTIPPLPSALISRISGWYNLLSGSFRPASIRFTSSEGIGLVDQPRLSDSALSCSSPSFWYAAWINRDPVNFLFLKYKSRLLISTKISMSSLVFSPFPCCEYCGGKCVF